MTWTHGYICPNCLSWFIAYLNKDGVMCCGCKTAIEDSIYLYRKTYGNSIFGISSNDIKIHYKQVKFRFSFIENTTLRELKRLVIDTIKAMNKDFLLKDRNLLYIALKKALYGASSRDVWYERCPKCQNYKGNRKCELENHEWLSVKCEDFKLKERIKKFLNSYIDKMKKIREEINNKITLFDF